MRQLLLNAREKPVNVHAFASGGAIAESPVAARSDAVHRLERSGWCPRAMARSHD
jgi:hypothetical protein